MTLNDRIFCEHSVVSVLLNAHRILHQVSDPRASASRVFNKVCNAHSFSKQAIHHAVGNLVVAN